MVQYIIKKELRQGNINKPKPTLKNKKLAFELEDITHLIVDTEANKVKRIEFLNNKPTLSFNYNEAEKLNLISSVMLLDDILSEFQIKKSP